MTDGATASAHAARRFLSRCLKKEGILKLDFKNAFNTIDRAAVLKAVLNHFPELASYALASYGTPSWLSTESIASSPLREFNRATYFILCFSHWPLTLQHLLLTLHSIRGI